MKKTILFLILSAGLVLFSTQIRSPFLLPFRPFCLSLTIAIAIIGILFLFRELSQNQIKFKKRLVLFGIGLFATAVCISIIKETEFRRLRSRVLNVDPKAFKVYGRHFIVGYTDFNEIKMLTEKEAIGGVFITARNVEGKSFEQIQNEIETLQKIRKRQKLPPLWIATDQEGGGVSRLSPPLDWQPSLGEEIRGLEDPNLIKERVKAYATKQATGLKSIGVNLNLSPVVDLRKHSDTKLFDLHTRIWERALSDDPNRVIEIAKTYIESFEEAGVQTTLKHFPGLGRLSEDTHVEDAHLKESIESLESSDWKPFRALIQDHSPFLMLGHVHLDAIDSENPSSVSKKVIQEIIRKKWGYNEKLITDDFTMQPIYKRKGGIGKATRDAIHAGVDFILISYDPDLYYEAMAGLLD